MVFNSTFNTISVISWWSVLLVEQTGKTTDLPQVTDKRYYIMLYIRIEYTSLMIGVRIHNLGTDCPGGCKSNYHAITTTTAHIIHWEAGLFDFCTTDRILHYNKTH